MLGVALDLEGENLKSFDLKAPQLLCVRNNSNTYFKVTGSKS